MLNARKRIHYICEGGGDTDCGLTPTEAVCCPLDDEMLAKYSLPNFRITLQHKLSKTQQPKSLKETNFNTR
jgi:hypothetical protein